MAMPSARATHAPHRANLRCLGLTVGIAIAVAACSQPAPAEATDNFKWEIACEAYRIGRIASNDLRLGSDADEREISSIFYSELVDMAKCVPGMRAAIAHALADRRITYSEYAALEQEEDRLAQETHDLVERAELQRLKSSLLAATAEGETP